jgi:hypothetical protein
MITLVRHATPLLHPAAPPRPWRLGAQGLAAARQPHLAPHAHLVEVVP